MEIVLRVVVISAFAGALALIYYLYKCIFYEPEPQPVKIFYDSAFAERTAKIQSELLQLQTQAIIDCARYTGLHECAGCGYQSNLWQCPKCRRMHRAIPFKNQNVRWL